MNPAYPTSRPTALRRKALTALAAVALTALAGSGAYADDQTRPPEPMKPLKPAEIDETLIIGGEEIAARKLASRMTVETRINGDGPYRFVVDSGADTSVVSHRVAASLALPRGTPVILNGMTETRLVERVHVASLELGSARFTDLELPVLDPVDIGGDGMIGLDALVQQRLMMDFEKRIVTVDDATLPERSSPDEIVVIGRLQRGQLILTQVTVNRTEVEAVVDTWSEITIGNSKLRETIGRRNARDSRKIRVYGVTGAARDMEVIVVSRLRLGPVTLSNVPIAFDDVPPFTAFGMQDRPSLMLGTDIMETFRRVSLDFHRRKARFQLRKCGSSTVAMRTGGSASRLKAELPSTCAR